MPHKWNCHKTRLDLWDLHQDATIFMLNAHRKQPFLLSGNGLEDVKMINFPLTENACL